MNRWKKIVGAVVVLAALGIGGFLVWFYVIKADAPPALSTSDLDKALSDTTTAGGATTVAGAAAVASTLPVSSVVASTSAPSATAGTDSSAVTAGTATGTWTLTSDSTVGYRVSEVLSGLDTEAAGRTNDATGSLTIDGTKATAGEFTVNMASIASDSNQRDGQFRGRIMSVSQFPTATFKLASPIEFGAVPAEGVTIPAKATGDLTLRGVTRSVTFDVQAKLANGKIGVLGSIPIKFSDYEIPDPTTGIAKVKDNGLLEFVLVFARS